MASIIKKSHFLLFLLILFPIFLFAQDKPKAGSVEAVKPDGFRVVCNSNPHESSLTQNSSQPVTAQVQVLQPKSVTQAEYKQAVAIDVTYRQKYHMGYNETENMMHLGYEDFIKKLFTDDRFTDEIFCKLWNDYLDRYTFKLQRNVEKYTKQIQDKLKWRKNQRQQQEKIDQEKMIQQQLFVKDQERKRIEKEQELQRLQEQQRLQQKQEQLRLQQKYFIADLYDIDDLSLQAQDRLHSRQQALEQTKIENYRSYEQLHALTDLAQGYLFAQGLNPSDYLIVQATTMQHQLQEELCMLFEQAAQRQAGLLYNNNLLKQAVNFADAAHTANANEQVRLTCLLSDVGYGYLSLDNDVNEYDLKFWIAVGKGIVHSAQKTAMMLADPVGTVQSLGKLILEIKSMLPFDCGQCPFKVNCSGVCVDDLMLSNPMRKIDAVYDGLVALEHGISSWMINSSMEQKAAGMSELAADIIVPDVLFTKISKSIGFIASRAKVLRSMESAGVLLEDEWGMQQLMQSGVSPVEAVELAVQTEVGTELVGICKSDGLIAVQDGVQAEMVDGVDVAKQLSKSYRSIDEISVEIKALGGNVKLSNDRLCQEVKDITRHFVEEVNRIINPASQQVNSWRHYLNGSIKTKTNLDVQHIATFSCEFIKKRQEGRLEVLIKGGHLAGGCEALEATGIVKIIEKKLLSNGCFEYSLEHGLTGTPFKKTEFPAHWDINKLIQNCWEVYENQNSVESLTQDGKKFIREGIVENCKIQLILKKYDQGCNIITAYPI